MTFDGLVSALRTRTLAEVERMVFDTKTSAKQQWSFRSSREMHTFPLGYFTSFIGTRRRA
jgi:hypothetical protein